MSFIRKREEELTGYQEAAFYNDKIDLQCDFVMVYGTDETMPTRIKKFKEKGYVVHLMTGSAWGEYQDYLFGKWDDREHWDESQMTREGKHVLHGEDVPYMVPTVSFSDYLTEKLKVAVDSGVVAIHLEEPEFWDFSGYSEAFKREYKLYYKEDWQPPFSDIDVRYKISKLKAYLYARALTRISTSLKEYALVKYNLVLRIYIPTHSLLNYTQWKIMSPEGMLTDIPSLDGYIAQIWTGTSRSANVYEGMLKERTFETSYLEYGIMQELVKGTGRNMWFLHDPIEDNPEYDWDNYRKNYLKTVTASLFHPFICTYEICPWPNRVFNGKYPADKTTGKPTKDSKPIPSDYANLLSTLIQTLGDMNQTDIKYDGFNKAIGILMSDSGLFQRTFPDGIVKNKNDMLSKMSEMTKRWQNGNLTDNESKKFFEPVKDNEDLFNTFIESEAFPNFYGMALPLLKYALPVRPVQLDNLKRFPGYLDDYQHLILSYEYIKPESPDINNGIAAWIHSGGVLFYIGDGSDPYHNIKSWWNTGNANYSNPAEHLFEILGIPSKAKDGTYNIGKGKIVIWNTKPAKLCLNSQLAEEYRNFIKKNLKVDGINWSYSNRLTLRRGPYVITTVMAESYGIDNFVLNGTFVDLYDYNLPIIKKKIIEPDQNCLLFDLDYIKQENCRIIASSARIFELTFDKSIVKLTLKAADSIDVRARIKLPEKVIKASAVDEDGEPVAINFDWDIETSTVLFCYSSKAKQVVVTAEV